MGINRPIVTEIANKTFAINEFGMAACFLLWGDERGILIDCGCGMYNIREIADEICPLPYDVVVTHCHGDHIGSIDRFDEVWMNFPDIMTLRKQNPQEEMERLRSYVRHMAAFGCYDAYDISPDQVHVPEKLPNLKPLEREHVFHLGGRDVYVIDMPGHTAGEIALVDPYSRIAFTGDACNINLSIRCASIIRALEGMRKLKSMQYMFDRNYPGHVGYGGSTVIRSMPEEVLDECLYILENVKNEVIIPQIADIPKTPDGEDNYSVTYGHTKISFTKRVFAYCGLFQNPDQKENVPLPLLERKRSKMGQIECLTYNTKAYGTDMHPIQKELYVYLPADYDPARKYPILYLMHGGGDNETYWLANHDETSLIADHMMSEGLAEPTIICTPTIYNRDGSDGRGIHREITHQFYKELRTDIIPAVEGKYATYAGGDTSIESLIASRDKRGFAGLSMGSMTTYWSALYRCLDIISYFGPFSGCQGPGGDEEAAAEKLHQAIDVEFGKYPIRYLLAVNGTRDIAHDEHVNIMKLLLEKTDKLEEGVNYAFIDNEGAYHDDQAWEYAFYRFLQICAKS